MAAEDDDASNGPNKIDKSAADVLLQAVSAVSENSSVVVIIETFDEETKHLNLRSFMNVTHQDAHWLVSQSLFSILKDYFMPDEES